MLLDHSRHNIKYPMNLLTMNIITNWQPQLIIKALSVLLSNYLQLFMFLLFFSVIYIAPGTYGVAFQFQNLLGWGSYRAPGLLEFPSTDNIPQGKPLSPGIPQHWYNIPQGKPLSGHCMVSLYTIVIVCCVKSPSHWGALQVIPQVGKKVFRSCLIIQASNEGEFPANDVREPCQA